MVFGGLRKATFVFSEHRKINVGWSTTRPPPIVCAGNVTHQVNTQLIFQWKFVRSDRSKILTQEESTSAALSILMRFSFFASTTQVLIGAFAFSTSSPSLLAWCFFSHPRQVYFNYFIFFVFLGFHHFRFIFDPCSRFSSCLVFG